MDKDGRKLSLYDGTWWKSVTSDSHSLASHIHLRIEDGKAFLHDSMGHTVPPSVTIEILNLLRNYIVNNTDEDILKKNISMLDEEPLIYTKGKTTKPKPILGYLYAVRCGNKLKLGRTKNLKLRLQSYKKVTDVFNILATAKVNDYLLAEKELISYFGGKVGKQEWFNYESELHISVCEYFKKNLNGEIHL